MNGDRICLACGEPEHDDERLTLLDPAGRGHRCGPDLDRESTAATESRHSSRWKLVALASLVALATTFIGVAVAHRRSVTGKGQISDDEADDFFDEDDEDYFGSCDECGDRAGYHYCPECHGSDD